MPIVVVGNQTDQAREVSKEECEAVVTLDWEHGYVECCAKDNTNISQIFRELLHQAKAKFDFSNCAGGRPGTPLVIRCIAHCCTPHSQ